jgi:hypothetical protein
LTKETVWVFPFHVGTGVGGVVGGVVGGGGDVVMMEVIFAYTTRGGAVMDGVGVTNDRPVLTGWPVVIGLMTNAITRMMQNAAIVYVISFLSMTAAVFYCGVHK